MYARAADTGRLTARAAGTGSLSPLLTRRQICGVTIFALPRSVRKEEQRITIVEGDLGGCLLGGLWGGMAPSSLVSHQPITHRSFRAARFTRCPRIPTSRSGLVQPDDRGQRNCSDVFCLRESLIAWLSSDDPAPGS